MKRFISSKLFGGTGPRDFVECRTVMVLCCVACLASCVPLTVVTDFDRKANFDSMTTYDWIPGPQNFPDNPRISNAAMDARIRLLIDEALRAKGYQRETAHPPDFYVGYHAAIGTALPVHGINSYYGYDVDRSWHVPDRRGGARDHLPATIGGRVYAYEYEEGSLILDVVAPTRKHLVWRGCAKQVVDTAASPEESSTLIQKAIAQMLDSFPPLASSR